MIQGVRYLSDVEAKKAMTDVGKRMAEKGYVIASDGSLSVRVGPNAVWITVGDANKGSLSQDMMVKVDLDGNPVMRAKTAELPEEMKLHLKLYRDNENVRAVIHGCPPVATGLGIQGIAIEGAGFTKTLRKLGSVPVVPCGDMDAAAQAVGRIGKSGRGVLLQNNGCMTWGETPQDAFGMLEAMEYYGIVLRGMGGGAPGMCGTTVAALQSGTTVQAGVALQPGVAGQLGTTMQAGMAVQSGMAVQPKLSGVTELVKPGSFQSSTSDVIHNMNCGAVGNRETGYQTSGYQNPVSRTPAPSQPPASPAHPAAVVPVTEKPKADVMAEVVRRTMQNYH